MRSNIVNIQHSRFNIQHSVLDIEDCMEHWTKIGKLARIRCPCDFNALSHSQAQLWYLHEHAAHWGPSSWCTIYSFWIWLYCGVHCSCRHEAYESTYLCPCQGSLDSASFVSLWNNSLDDSFGLSTDAGEFQAMSLPATSNQLSVGPSVKTACRCLHGQQEHITVWIMSLAGHVGYLASHSNDHLTVHRRKMATECSQRLQ